MYDEGICANNNLIEDSRERTFSETRALIFTHTGGAARAALLLVSLVLGGMASGASPCHLFILPAVLESGAEEATEPIILEHLAS